MIIDLTNDEGTTMQTTEILARIHHHNSHGSTGTVGTVVAIVIVLLIAGIYGYLKYTGNSRN